MIYIKIKDLRRIFNLYDPEDSQSPLYQLLRKILPPEYGSEAVEESHISDEKLAELLLLVPKLSDHEANFLTRLLFRNKEIDEKQNSEDARNNRLDFCTKLSKLSESKVTPYYIVNCLQEFTSRPSLTKEKIIIERIKAQFNDFLKKVAIYNSSIPFDDFLEDFYIDSEDNPLNFSSVEKAYKYEGNKNGFARLVFFFYRLKAGYLIPPRYLSNLVELHALAYNEFQAKLNLELENLTKKTLALFPALEILAPKGRITNKDTELQTEFDQLLAVVNHLIETTNGNQQETLKIVEKNIREVKQRLAPLHKINTEYTNLLLRFNEKDIIANAYAIDEIEEFIINPSIERLIKVLSKSNQSEMPNLVENWYMAVRNFKDLRMQFLTLKKVGNYKNQLEALENALESGKDIKWVELFDDTVILSAALQCKDGVHCFHKNVIVKVLNIKPDFLVGLEKHILDSIAEQYPDLQKFIPQPNVSKQSIFAQANNVPTQSATPTNNYRLED